jgi:hypothetical protein
MRKSNGSISFFGYDSYLTLFIWDFSVSSKVVSFVLCSCVILNPSISPTNPLNYNEGMAFYYMINNKKTQMLHAIRKNSLVLYFARTRGDNETVNVQLITKLVNHTHCKVNVR